MSYILQQSLRGCTLDTDCMQSCIAPDEPGNPCFRVDSRARLKVNGEVVPLSEISTISWNTIPS